MSVTSHGDVGQPPGPAGDTTASEVFIVDDDRDLGRALSALLGRAGFRATCFADGETFLAAARARVPAGVVLDVRMPGRSGISILKELRGCDFPAPVLVMSGIGNIPMAVDAMRHGADDFIEKPFDRDAVVARVRAAIEARRTADRASREANFADRPFAGRELLTRRERQVLAEIVSGQSNASIAALLGISRRTVEVHRARILQKLLAKNTADLVRMVVVGAGRSPAG